MSEEIKKINFGAINDQDESLKGASDSGRFGLNQGYITKLEFNPNAGADGSAGNAVDITFTVVDKEYRRRIFDVTKVFGKNGELTDTNSPEYIKAYNQSMLQAMAVIVHAVKATGVTQAQIDTALAQPKNSFEEWSKTIVSLVPQDYDKKPIDGFLEYQWNIKEGQNKTYLELPKNMKGGYFLALHVEPVGKWVEQKSWVEKSKDGKEVKKEGLRYVDDAGNIHLFARSENYMESNKAIQQFEKGEDTLNPNNFSKLPISSSSSSETTW